jgi:hypothetical protein
MLIRHFSYTKMSHPTVAAPPDQAYRRDSRVQQGGMLTMLERQSDLLLQVRQGMEVYDEHNHKIGTVDFVKFGDDSIDADDTAEITAEADQPDELYEARMETLMLELDSASLIPEELRERMANEGFVRVDTGLLHHARYILPEQIQSVGPDRIQIEGSRESLIEAL